MNNLFRKILTLIFLIFYIYVFTYSEEIKTNDKKNICFLYYKSEYKLALMKEIKNKLSKMNIDIKMDLIKNMDKYNPENFDAVVLFSGIKAFSPYPRAIKYIKQHNYAKNIIYFCAASTVKDSVYGFLDQEKIDAVSSASQKDNINEVSGMVINRILEIIK